MNDNNNDNGRRVDPNPETDHRHTVRGEIAEVDRRATKETVVLKATREMIVNNHSNRDGAHVAFHNPPVKIPEANCQIGEVKLPSVALMEEVDSKGVLDSSNNNSYGKTDHNPKTRTLFCSKAGSAEDDRSKDHKLLIDSAVATNGKITSAWTEILPNP